MKPLSWKPIRRGDIYCSPACGAHCKHAAYLTARRESRETLARLKTRGWKARVWENMGWHWSLTNSLVGISLHYDKYDKKFWTMFSCEPGALCGDPRFNYSDKCADPNRAVAQQVKRALPTLRDMAHAYYAMKGFLPPGKK